MDTSSAAGAARLLGTSPPRVKRAIHRLGLDVAERRGGRVQLTPGQVRRLGQELGVATDVPGLSRTEILALAALARSPLGLVSARAVARRAGLSPTAAARAVRTLEGRGLVQREREWVAAGKAQQVEVIKPSFSSPEWPTIAPKLASVRPSSRPRQRRAAQVPARLRHLFWNTAPSQLDTRAAGDYIARRRLVTDDPAGLAWGAVNLRPADWRQAARARGLAPETRALALTLSEAGDGSS